MTRSIGRIAALAATLALSLALVAIGPAAAVDTPVTRASGAEKYALKLLNCTRTGGWVRADGSCNGRFSGKYSAYRKPLRLHRKISDRTAWPWARTLALAKVCAHALPGEPDLVRRMRSSGFRYWQYGENIGCGGGNPRQLVLATHRMMQAEKSYNGGHWVNIKNRGFRSVGIGVATQGGTTMVVYDFYGKLY